MITTNFKISYFGFKFDRKSTLFSSLSKIDLKRAREKDWVLRDDSKSWSESSQAHKAYVLTVDSDLASSGLDKPKQA